MAKKKRKQKNDPKRNWMVGILIFAMLAFVLTQIPWGNFSSNSSNKTTTTKKVATNTVSDFDKEFKTESTLSFTNEQGTEIVNVDIAVARSQEEINLGLMHRKKMPDHAGMLFLMPVEKVQNFWMRNTYIPLDIIYINSAKEIVHIAQNTKPLSDDPITSIYPAVYVLEVNAGFANAYELKKGQKANFNVN